MCEEVGEVASSSHESGGGAVFVDLVELRERFLREPLSPSCDQQRK